MNYSVLHSRKTKLTREYDEKTEFYYRLRILMTRTYSWNYCYLDFSYQAHIERTIIFSLQEGFLQLKCVRNISWKRWFCNYFTIYVSLTYFLSILWREIFGIYQISLPINPYSPPLPDHSSIRIKSRERVNLSSWDEYNDFPEKFPGGSDVTFRIPHLQINLFHEIWRRGPELHNQITQKTT